MATNDITGDEIRSKVNSEKFRDGWDAIFGKKGKDITIVSVDELTGMTEEEVDSYCRQVKEGSN